RADPAHRLADHCYVRSQLCARRRELSSPRCRRAAAASRGLKRISAALIVWLILCYAFLYAPIGFLVALSFNATRLVTAWDGFSLRWYATLWHDDVLISAALLSLRIAAASATLALIIGTLAGYALARFGRFRTRAALTATLAAPLVIP